MKEWTTGNIPKNRGAYRPVLKKYPRAKDQHFLCARLLLFARAQKSPLIIVVPVSFGYVLPRAWPRRLVPWVLPLRGLLLSPEARSKARHNRLTSSRKPTGKRLPRRAAITNRVLAICPLARSEAFPPFRWLAPPRISNEVGCRCRIKQTLTTILSFNTETMSSPPSESYEPTQLSQTLKFARRDVCFSDPEPLRVH